MSKLTLDKAIKHCLEAAKKNEAQAEKWQEEGGEEWGKTTACRESAAEQRQLAEWLIELKKAKRFIREIENKFYLGTSFYSTSFLKENEKLFDELTKGVEYLDT